VVIELSEKVIDCHTALRIKILDLSFKERNRYSFGRGMDREWQFEQMVLHGGDVVIHTRVQERQHYLLHDECQSVHFLL